jgi:hypothetical protein
MQSPWYGYSLGLWSDESQEEAELAIKGKHLQTAAKLENRHVSTPPGSRIVEVRKAVRQREGSK